MIWKTVVVLFVFGTLVEASTFGLMCRSNGREDIADEVDKKVVEAVQCMNNVFDLETAKKDFIDSISTGTVSSVLKRYCSKSSELKVCINQYYTAAAPCLQTFIQNNIDAVYNATSEAVDYVCYNDGERINSFVAEGGFQCFHEKTDAFKNCGSSVTEVPPINSPNSHEVHCRMFTDGEACVISTLEGCSTSAAANLAKGLFAIAKKAHSCTQ